MIKTPTIINNHDFLGSARSNMPTAANVSPIGVVKAQTKKRGPPTAQIVSLTWAGGVYLYIGVTHQLMANPITNT